MTSDEATLEMITGAVLSAKLKDPLNPGWSRNGAHRRLRGGFDGTTASVYVEVSSNFTSQ